MSVFDDWKGKPPAPEWRHWRLRKRINAWEAIALSMGIEPRAVRFSAYGWMSGGPPHFDTKFHAESQADEYASRLRILADYIGEPEHFAPGALSLSGPHLHEVTVADFARWVRDIAEWDAPAELVELAGPLAVESNQPESRSYEPAPLSTGDMAALLDGIEKRTESGWLAMLADTPKWLICARVLRGAPGRRTPAAWNPVNVALALQSRGAPAAKLRAIFKHRLAAHWADEWTRVNQAADDFKI